MMTCIAGVRTFGMKGSDSDSKDDELYVELQIRAANEVLEEVSKGINHR